MNNPHLTDTLRANGYTVPPCPVDSVGDWQGDEERAAEQFRALCVAVAEAMPDPRTVDLGDEGLNALESDRLREEYDSACRDLWDRYGSDADLLTLTPDDVGYQFAASYNAAAYLRDADRKSEHPTERAQRMIERVAGEA